MDKIQVILPTLAPLLIMGLYVLTSVIYKHWRANILNRLKKKYDLHYKKCEKLKSKIEKKEFEEYGS